MGIWIDVRKWITVGALLATTVAAAPAGPRPVIVNDPRGDATPQGIDFRHASDELSDDGTDLTSIEVRRLDAEVTEVRVAFLAMGSTSAGPGPHGNAPRRDVRPRTSFSVRTQVGGCALTLTGRVHGSSGMLRLCDWVDTVDLATHGPHDRMAFVVDLERLRPEIADHLRRPRAIARGLYARAATDAVDTGGARAMTTFDAIGPTCRGWCHVDEASDPEVRFHF